MHSHLGNWPRTAKYLRSQRAAHESANETVLMFDIGDACDRVHPLTEATNGQAITRLLNNAHYDAVTIGNNEGIGSTKKELDHLYDDADFKVILSNLVDQETNRVPDWAVPIKIYKTKEGTRLGVIACTIPLTLSYDPLGWNVEDPFITIERMLEQYEPFVDQWILMSHLGIDFDREIAERFPDIDLILGAHTHHLLPEGEQVNDTLLTGAGRYGEYIGRIELEITDHTIKKTAARVVRIDQEVEPAAHERTLVYQYLQLGHELLQKQQISTIPDLLEANWKQCTNFVKVGLDAISEQAETELAILNSGLFLQPLIEGIVTNDDLHRALPHPMRVLKYTMRGNELETMILSMEEQREKLQDLTIKGLGFRGKVFGQLCYKNIQVLDGKEILIKGEPIESEKDYVLASVDHYLFLPFFPEISQQSNYKVLFPYFLRRVVGEYLKQHYPLI